jgi:hypothetical protein
VSEITIRCAATGLEKPTRLLPDGTPALPPRWKRVGQLAYSPRGFAECYVTRCARLPVASVVCGRAGLDWSVQATTEGWQHFRRAVRASCLDAARFCNWCFAEFAKADTEPLADSGKRDHYGRPLLTLPKLALPKHLYGAGRLLYPLLDSQSLGSLIQRAWKKYQEERFEIRFLCRRSLPSYREDTPVPIPAKDAPLSVNDQGQLFARVRVHGEAFTLRLRNGRDFQQPLDRVRLILAGEARQGELCLYEQEVGSDRRNRASRRVQPGANRVATEFVAAISYNALKQSRQGKATARVTLTPGRLWTVTVGQSERPWFCNEAQRHQFEAEFRRKTALGEKHRERLQLISEDRKLERRLPKVYRASLNGVTGDLARRHHNRMTSLCHGASRMLANFLARQFSGKPREEKLGTVYYDDSNQESFANFPVFTLRSMVRQKVEELGITFVHINGSEETTTETVHES